MDQIGKGELFSGVQIKYDHVLISAYYIYVSKKPLWELGYEVQLYFA